VVVYGCAYGAFSPLRASVMANHFGRRAYGAITAVQGIPVALCAGLGPLAAGWLYDVLHHYELAFWLCAGAFLLAAIGIALVPRPGEWPTGSTQAPGVTDEDLVESGGEQGKKSKDASFWRNHRLSLEKASTREEDTG
jgi:MFS family permease